MKKNKIIAFLLALNVLSVPLALNSEKQLFSPIISNSIDEETSATFSFDEETGTASFSGTGKVERPVFPSIAEKLKKVIISDGITSIDEGAFSDCSLLTSVTIPDSVTSIGGHAFSGCSSLESINIPDGVTIIDFYTFNDCSSLKSITIPDSVTYIRGYAFNGCSSLESVTIPDSVTLLGVSAFCLCENLKEIKLSESLKQIKYDTFNNCTSLTSIEIPEKVSEIGECAFYGCTSLESVKISTSVTDIDGHAFTNCSKLTDIYYSGNQVSWDEKNFTSNLSTNSGLNMENITIHFGSEEVASEIFGDMNSDGFVDANDASLILGFYAYVSTGGQITDMREWLKLQ